MASHAAAMFIARLEPAMRLRRARISVVDSLVLVTCGAAVIVSAAALSQRSAEIPAPPVVPSLDSLIGRVLAPLPVLTADGGRQTISFGRDRPTLVLVFRSTCPACERTAPTWKALSESVASHASIAVVNSEEHSVVQTWLRRHDITADVAVVAVDGGQGLVSTWGFPGVPVTIAVGKDGRILAAHLGILSDGAASELRAALTR